MDIYHNSSNVGKVNKTLITLIPKVEPTVNLNQFRSISLCNVHTKLLRKCIPIDRYKLVTSTQCSFVLGQHSLDNIIVTQEVIHSMHRKKGDKGWMAIKIDLEKVYDRLKWSFLKENLEDIGF